MLLRERQRERERETWSSTLQAFFSSFWVHRLCFRGSGLLDLLDLGGPNLLKLTRWFSGTNRSTLERKRVRAHQIGEPRKTDIPQVASRIIGHTVGPWDLPRTYRRALGPA